MTLSPIPRPIHHHPRRATAVFRSILGRLLAFSLIFTFLGSLSAPFASAQEEVDWAPPTAVYIDDTGQVVDQTFLDTWRSNQILIGDPISKESKAKFRLKGVETKSRVVQYYQNVALVSTYDDARGDDWNVVAANLGQWAFDQDTAKLKKEDIPKASDCEGLSDEDCLYFENTGHSVKLGFKGYWEANSGAQLIGAPLTQEYVAKDGWTTQYFQKAVLRWNEDEGIVPRSLGTEYAKEEALSTRASKQPDNVPSYDESLFHEPVVATTPTGPGPIQGGYKEIVVSISQQYLWAYEDGATVLETYVSTGTAETPAVTTPTGYFSILTKLDSQTMEGTISGQYYRVEDVPYVMYFDNLGDALHGTYWHNNFGQPMSHGCVNLPMDVAAWMYGWAPVGTPVTVIA